MGLLDIDLNEVPDQRILEPGEHELRIDKVEQKTSKKGADMLSVMFIPLDDAVADPLFEYIVFPSMEDDERTALQKKRRLKNCVSAFGIDDWQDLDSWVGKTGYAITAQQSDETFGDKAVIQKYCIPGA